MLPAFSPTSRGQSDVVRFFHEEEDASFHEHGTFFAIWLLVFFVSVSILGKVRAILEPILWAFFLVMGLWPMTDLVEAALIRMSAVCGRMCYGAAHEITIGKTSSERRSSSAEGTEKSTRSMQSEFSGGNSRRTRSQRETPLADTGATTPTAGADAEDSSESEAEETSEEAKGCSEGGCVRTIAVVIVLLSSIGCGALFFIMVYKSAVHMQESWPHYQRGAQRITERTEAWMDTLPDKMLHKMTDKALSGMEEALSSLVGGLLEATTHTLIELLWVFLYTIFWLCQPVHIGKDVSAVFRRYIFLKGLASAGYAFCIWILLHVLGVDLAIVFGLVTFVLNFIPEVGPFIAMMLPLPVILFDDRMRNNFQFMVLALVGQLSLKVVFGNIVEIKLIESQQEMRMHPVVILFFVAFFQFIWGATGMLLSVPIMSALKATLHKIPPAYRNPILIFLEGDKSAPVRWRQWRDDLQRSEVLAAATAQRT